MSARPRIVVLVGLPGSGKSFWAARQRAGVLSSDAVRALLTGTEENQDVNSLVFQTLRFLLKMRLRAGAGVTIIDATSLTARERRPYILLAAALGCSSEAVFFDTPLDTCKARNAARSRVVPGDVMNRFAARLTPPSTDEGFAKVKVIKP